MNLKSFILILLIITTLKIKAQDSLSVEYVQPLFDFNGSKPLFNLSDEQKDNKNRFLRFYAFTGYREGIEPVKRAFGFNMDTQPDEAQGTINQRMYNLSIVEMLTFGMRKPSEVILDVKDPSRYKYLPSYGPKLAWMRKNAYCYELTVPRETFKDLKSVEADMDKFFNVIHFWEKRKARILVLSAADPDMEAKTIPKVIEGTGVVNLTEFEQLLYEKASLILAVKLKRNDRLFDLGSDFKTASVFDLKKLQKTLRKQGFLLTQEERELDFFVIRENKK